MITLPEPLSASYTTGPCMIIGFDRTEFGSGIALIVQSDGVLTFATFDELNVDWRYSSQHQTWVDVGPDIGVIDDESDQEETDDGGQEVSGYLPDAD